MNNTLKKILASAGLLGAFGLGGAAIAGAQGDKPADRPAASQPSTPQSEAAEPAGGTEQGETGETGQKVAGADADRAGQAALRSAGDGKVMSVEKETPEQGADTPEPGEKPDSAQEQATDQKTAYSVEVQKSDGSTVDVALDDAFNVLASEQDNESGSEEGEEAGAQR